MIRKLTVVLLAGVICLLGITSALQAKEGLIQTFEGKEIGPLPEEYDEAPIFKTKVAAGILPPVEQRLPEQPMVIKPIDGIGQYGGTLVVTGLGPGTAGEICGFQETHIFHLNDVSAEVLPEIARGYKFSEDYKTLTIFLRKGMKWSDGIPFTVDDILFWWEDVANNEELSPQGPPSWWKVEEELPRFEEVDDYTLRIHFPKPNRPILGALTSWMAQQDLFYRPKHYVKKWHIKYNPKANELAKEEGYDYWWEAFNERQVGWWVWDKIGIPVVKAWVQKKVTPTVRVYERNPYYYAVDTAGNQLPYIDEIKLLMCGDQEMVNMKTIGGELSFASRMLQVGNYPLYMENAEKGDYRVLAWKRGEASAMAFAFNLDHKDQVLRKIFQDVRFRRAMSLAINRDEINKVVFYGLATPGQLTVDPNCSFYKEEWAEAYAQYDPEKANALLDETGLKWDTKHQYRLRPDGKILSITIELIEGVSPDMIKICDLTEGYWRNVGVKMGYKTVERALRAQRMQANEFDVSWWAVDGMEEYHVYIPGMPQIQPDRNEIGWAIDWGRWWKTGGKTGSEPPEEYKQLFKTFDEWYTTTSEQEYKRLAQKIFDFYAEKMIVIGTVGYAPMPTVIKSSLRNVPEKAIYGENSFWGIIVLPMQFAFGLK